MKLENVVRFSSHPRPFLISDDYCENPDCECIDVFLKFTEVDEKGSRLAAPLAFGMRVDLETWEEPDPPDRPPQIAEFAKEFLEGFPPEKREEFRAACDRTKKIVRRLADYRIRPEDVEDGTLVSYCDVASETGGLSRGGSTCSYRFRHEGREFAVENLYCCNPACHCRDAHLLFFEYMADPDGPPDQGRLYERFRATVSLDGRREVEKDYVACSLDEAGEILAAWAERYPDDLRVLKSRYDDIKEIGRRSLASRGSRPARSRRPLPGDAYRDEPAHSQGRTARNAPCPCGSGKKYKKCCGRNAPIRP